MTTRTKHLFSGLAVIIFIALAVASTDNQQTEKDIASAPAIRVGAQRLYNDYQANEVAADQKYKDQVLIVTGIVSSIGKDVMGEIYVCLDGDGYGIGTVQCTMGDNHTNEAAQLRKGMRASIKGKCEGGTIGILMSGCSLQ